MSRGIPLVLVVLIVADARAFGPAGHIVAGEIAEGRLCLPALREIDRLGDGESVGELGMWADRIRSTERWRDSAPWHYMNIADDAPLEAYRTPAEGDILWAIDRFSARLVDRSLNHEDRANALRFLVHFVVDLHQPLHVGRSEDRGGNAIEITVSGETVNLHSYWDSFVLRDELPVSDYLRRTAALIPLLEESLAETAPSGWAVESQALRGVVYSFDADTGLIGPRYEATASDVARLRLIQAGLRLAGRLNALLCPGTGGLLGP